MITALIITGAVIAYSVNWLFAAKCFREDDDMLGLLFAAVFGMFPIPIAFWYAYCRPSKSDRMLKATEELEKRAVLIERMAKAINSVPAERWHVVRAEHLDEIVQKLSKK